uniref:Uncharacterized protein n=1 Tax=viral metagenome TaxID=1070528 RepID=A0A6H1ZS09_9ZZZZ
MTTKLKPQKHYRIITFLGKLYFKLLITYDNLLKWFFNKTGIGKWLWFRLIEYRAKVTLKLFDNVECWMHKSGTSRATKRQFWRSMCYKHDFRIDYMLGLHQSIRRNRIKKNSGSTAVNVNKQPKKE